MPNSTQVVEHLGGIARGTELATWGFSRRLLAHCVAVGEIRRIRPGVFATHRTPTDIALAAGHGGALTCANALRHHGVWVLEEDTAIHVWLGRSGRVHHGRCRCVAHYNKGRMRLGVAPVEDALTHAFECHGEEFFFCAYESAWNKRLLSTAAHARIRAALPASAQWLVDFAQSTSESGLESLVRLRLHRLGIAVVAQVTIPNVGRVDFVVEGRVILEADGEENHSGLNRHRDLRRDAAASALGYESLRFDYAMIIREWPTVVAAILAALARARA